MIFYSYSEMLKWNCIFLHFLIGTAEHKWEDMIFTIVKKAAGTIILNTLKSFLAGDVNFKV